MHRLLTKALNLSFVILLLSTCAACKDIEGYSRKEWLDDVAEAMQIVSDEDTYDALVTWGIIDDTTEASNQDLDRDFMAYTLSNIIDDIETTDITIDDIAEAEYPDGLIDLVAKGILVVTNGKVYPKMTVSEEDALTSLNAVMAIVNDKTFVSGYEITFLTDPIFLEELPEVASSGYAIEAEVGDIILDESTSSFYEVVEEEDGYVMIEEVDFLDVVEDIKISGGIDDIDFDNAEVIIEGELEETSSLYDQEDISRLASFSPSGVFNKDGYRISYSLSVNKLHLHVSKKTDNGINVYFDGDIYGIDPSFNWDYSGGTINEAYLKLDFSTSEEVGLSVGRYKRLYGDIASLTGDDLFNSLKTFIKPRDDTVETSFTLMTLKLPIASMPFVSINVDVLLNLYISGKVEVALATDHSIGLEIKNNSLRLINDHDLDIDINIKATASSTLSLVFSLKLFAVLVDVRLNGGIKGIIGTTLHLYDSDGNLTSTAADVDYDVGQELSDRDDVYICGDLSLSWILNVEFNSTKSLAYALGFHRTLTILDEDDQIFGNLSHIEKGMFVEECSHKSSSTTSSSSSTYTPVSDRISLAYYSKVVREATTIEITGLPDGYTTSDLRYTSSDTSVAKINSDGTIIPVSSGVCEIRIYTSDEEYEVSLSVLVSIDDTTVSLWRL